MHERWETDSLKQSKDKAKAQERHKFTDPLLIEYNLLQLQETKTDGPEWKVI